MNPHDHAFELKRRGLYADAVDAYGVAADWAESDPSLARSIAREQDLDVDTDRRALPALQHEIARDLRRERRRLIALVWARWLFPEDDFEPNESRVTRPQHWAGVGDPRAEPRNFDVWLGSRGFVEVRVHDDRDPPRVEIVWGTPVVVKAFRERLRGRRPARRAGLR